MKDLILIGGGGHCRACIDVIEQHGVYSIAGIVDREERKGEKVLGYEIVASDDELHILFSRFRFFLVTLGQITNWARRKQLFDAVRAGGGELAVIVSPLAYVSRHARIGSGTIVMHHALVNAGAEVGSNCIVNTKALIEHDVTIGDHCHISTGSLVNGGVVIEEGSFWGSGAVARENIQVGRNSVIGCNATVKQSLPGGNTFK